MQERTSPLNKKTWRQTRIKAGVLEYVTFKKCAKKEKKKKKNSVKEAKEEWSLV